MKLFRNIPTLLKATASLSPIKENARRIDRCRAEEDFVNEEKEICAVEKKWGNDICERLGITLHVEGLENIPEGPVVFASNHQSYCDIPAIAAGLPGHGVQKGIGFVAKKELETLPLYGTWIRRIRSVFIDRGDARASLRAIDEAIKHLEMGFSMGIFPEGTRSKSDTMGEFKKGTLRLATKPGVPVVPVTLCGTWKLYEAQGYVKPGRVDIYIHPAIETKDMDRKEAAELPAVVEEIVRAKLVELQKRQAHEK